MLRVNKLSAETVGVACGRSGDSTDHRCKASLLPLLAGSWAAGPHNGDHKYLKVIPRCVGAGRRTPKMLPTPQDYPLTAVALPVAAEHQMSPTCTPQAA
jgi:hypothetical protein